MEATPGALDAIGAYLAGRGVGAYFPTTVTSSTEETMRSLAGLAREIGRGNPDGVALLRWGSIWKDRFFRTGSAECIRMRC